MSRLKLMLMSFSPLCDNVRVVSVGVLPDNMKVVLETLPPLAGPSHTPACQHGLDNHKAHSNALLSLVGKIQQLRADIKGFPHSTRITVRGSEMMWISKNNVVDLKVQNCRVF